jgi:hypothetical protein
MGQRSTMDVPGTGGAWSVNIGDITRGQVAVSLSGGGGVLMPERSMREGDTASFQSAGATYTLTLMELENQLMGEDHAVFRLAKGSADLSEAAKIEALIQALSALEGAVFIRNGKEHTVEEAVEHMRGKWKWKRKEIETAEDFIRVAATRSSTTGTPYEIVLADGTRMPSADWLTERLRETGREEP